MDDLRELDFFNVEGEPASKSKFSRRDSGVELEICYDYELARECPRLVKFIRAWKDREEKARAWIQRAPEFARGMHVPEWDDIDVEDESVWRPFIPSVALLAKWFPRPWLYGNASQRQEIAKVLEPPYSARRPLFVRPYPLDPADEKFIQSRIAMDNARRKHPANFRLYVLALDWTEPLTRAKERFLEWHQQNNPILGRQALLAEIKHLEGTPRHAEVLSRFPVLPPERKAYANFKPYQLLERLACYRLRKMNAVDRADVLSNLEWLTVKNLWRKMDQAKTAIEEDLKARHYLVKES